MRRIALFCLISMLVGCDFGEAAETPAVEAQTEATDEEASSADESDEPIEGCGWIGGWWELMDCAHENVLLHLADAGGCTVQVTSNHPIFGGAWGQAKDDALSLFLPTTGAQCQAAFDGEYLIGACGTMSGPCAIEAVPTETPFAE
jgi:hypothetical protein